MVGRLSHGAEEQVPFNQIAAREPVAADNICTARAQQSCRGSLDKSHAAWLLSSHLRLMWARGPPWKTLSLTVVLEDSAWKKADTCLPYTP